MDLYTVSAVVERIRQRRALKSNWAVGQSLGISTQALANWMKGRSFPDCRMSIILGQAAGIDPDILAAYYQAQRVAPGPERDLWLHVVRRLESDGKSRPDSEIFSVAGATDSIAPIAYRLPSPGRRTRAPRNLI